MDNENKQDAAEPSPASSGSAAGEPVAWLITGGDYEYATPLKERAKLIAEEEDGIVVPLYRLPTLTDSERKALLVARDYCRSTAGGYVGTDVPWQIDALLNRFEGKR